MLRATVLLRLLPMVVVGVAALILSPASLLARTANSVPATTKNPNILLNSNFENVARFDRDASCVGIPASHRAWSWYTENTHNAASLVADPVHSGKSAVEYKTTEVTNGTCGSAGYVYQDVGGPSCGTFSYSVWVYPDSGSQDMQVLCRWKHYDQVAHARFQVVFRPGQVKLVAFNQSGRFRQATGQKKGLLPKNTWSKIVLRYTGSKVTVHAGGIVKTLNISSLGITASKKGPTTLMVGNSEYRPAGASDYVYDDACFSRSSTTC